MSPTRSPLATYRRRNGVPTPKFLPETSGDHRSDIRPLRSGYDLQNHRALARRVAFASNARPLSGAAGRQQACASAPKPAARPVCPGGRSERERRGRSRRDGFPRRTSPNCPLRRSPRPGFWAHTGPTQHPAPERVGANGRNRSFATAGRSIA